MSNFSSLNLTQPLLVALKELGYETPTPIQAGAIPHLLQGRDLLGIAQTGTGKTAAFVLPILDRLSQQEGKAGPRRARALILTPTRELASQIYNSIASYGKHLKLFHAVIFGGVSERAQIQALKRGVDVLVATPGRLLDLLSQRHVYLDFVDMFVLDEADRMLDMGFLPDIQKIMNLLPKQRQTLLFSATMPKSIAVLSEKLLRQPVRVEVAPQSTTVERVEQKIFLVERNNKSRLLRSILQQDSLERVLVFTRTKQGANRVSEDLEKSSIASAAIHSNKSQRERERALEKFRNGNIRVLVATDIASRGIDVSNVTHVINYDLPEEPDSYVHRIGRTARAGREGTAISFCDASERRRLSSIERVIRCKVPVHSTPELIAPKLPIKNDFSEKEYSRNKYSQKAQPSSASKRKFFKTSNKGSYSKAPRRQFSRQGKVG